MLTMLKNYILLQENGNCLEMKYYITGYDFKSSQIKIKMEQLTIKPFFTFSMYKQFPRLHHNYFVLR